MQTEPAPLHELMRICMRGGTARQWEEFLARVQPLIARTAYRVACSAGSPQHDEVDDIVQETCLKLGATRTESLSRAELSSEASVWAYIKVVALNTARDHFAWKRRRPAITESELPAPIDQLAGAVQPDVDRHILYSQIDAALAGNERDRAVFWLYYRQGLTAKEISEVPAVGLTTKGVESLLSRMTQTVRRAFEVKPGEPEKGNAAAEAL